MAFTRRSRMRMSSRTSTASQQGQHAKALDRVNQYLSRKNRGTPTPASPGLDPRGAEQDRRGDRGLRRSLRDYRRCQSPTTTSPFSTLRRESTRRPASNSKNPFVRTRLRHGLREPGRCLNTKLASQAYDKACSFDSSNSAAKNKLSLIRDLISSNRLPGARARRRWLRRMPAGHPARTA